MSPETSEPAGDPWLDRWLALVAKRAADLPILELGCGAGRDTAVLAGAGHRVIAIDLSADSIARARARVPSAEFHCQDIRAPWPVSDGGAGVVLASLSLHYFSWPEMTALAERAHTALRPTGALLCRLNSTNDHHHGASGHPAIAENFYIVNGEPKRFFDHAGVSALFSSGWRTLGVAEMVIRRYEHPKSVWEVVLERDA